MQAYVGHLMTILKPGSEDSNHKQNVYRNIFAHLFNSRGYIQGQLVQYEINLIASLCILYQVRDRKNPRHIRYIFLQGRAMDQAVSRRPLTSEAWPRSQVEYFCFPLSVSFHQCSKGIFIYTLLLPEGRKAHTVKFPNSNALSEIGEHWIGKNFHFFIFIQHNLQ